MTPKKKSNSCKNSAQGSEHLPVLEKKSDILSAKKHASAHTVVSLAHSIYRYITAPLRFFSRALYFPIKKLQTIDRHVNRLGGFTHLMRTLLRSIRLHGFVYSFQKGCKALLEKLPTPLPVAPDVIDKNVMKMDL